MDSKWGIPIAAALAGMGLFLCTRSNSLVKEASLLQNPTIGGFKRSKSPQPQLLMYQEAQVANREYYRMMIAKAKQIGKSQMLPDFMIQNNVAKYREKFDIYNDLCAKAGILEPGKSGINQNLKPEWALFQRDDWKEKFGFSKSGGPLNPMEKVLMNMGSSRFHGQTMIKHLDPKTPAEWRKNLRQWEKGEIADEYGQDAYDALITEDIRAKYNDFDIEAQATQLYFFQFTLPGLITLQNYRVDRPFDFATVMRFMNDFLIYNSFMGAYMESFAIELLKATPTFKNEKWDVVKTHKKLDAKGADLMVFKINPNDPSDYTDTIGFIQVKPYGFVTQNAYLHKNADVPADVQTPYDNLINQAYDFHNPFRMNLNNPRTKKKSMWGSGNGKLPDGGRGIAKDNQTKWVKTTNVANPKSKYGRYRFISPQIGTHEESFEYVKQKHINDPNSPYYGKQNELGKILKRTYTVKGQKDEYERTEKDGRDIYLQLLVYEAELDSKNNIVDGRFLNLEPVVFRLLKNDPDPALHDWFDWAKPDPQNPKYPYDGQYLPIQGHNWWDGITDKAYFTNQAKS